MRRREIPGVTGMKYLQSTKLNGVTTSTSDTIRQGSENRNLANLNISLAWQLGNPPLSESLLGEG